MPGWRKDPWTDRHNANPRRMDAGVTLDVLVMAFLLGQYGRIISFMPRLAQTICLEPERIGG
jgi:hypothetical protein